MRKINLIEIGIICALVAIIGIVIVFAYKVLNNDDESTFWLPPNIVSIQISDMDDEVIKGIVQNDDNTTYKKGTTVNVSYVTEDLIDDELDLIVGDYVYVYYRRRNPEDGTVYYDSAKEYNK